MTPFPYRKRDKGNSWLEEGTPKSSKTAVFCLKCRSRCLNCRADQACQLPQRECPDARPDLPGVSDLGLPCQCRIYLGDLPARQSGSPRILFEQLSGRRYQPAPKGNFIRLQRARESVRLAKGKLLIALRRQLEQALRQLGQKKAVPQILASILSL